MPLGPCTDRQGTVQGPSLVLGPSLGQGPSVESLVAHCSSTLIVSGLFRRTLSTAPRPTRTSLPRVVRTAAVPAPPPMAAPIPAPFFPSINAPSPAPPAAGRAMVNASFFF